MENKKTKRKKTTTQRSVHPLWLRSESVGVDIIVV